MHPGIISWKNLLVYAFNAFSVPLLFKTLLSPWQMDRVSGSEYSFIEKFAFSVVTRLLGFVARLALIILGLIFTFLVLITFPIFFLIPVKISREYISSLPSFGSSLSYGNTYTLNAHSMDVMSDPSQKFFGKERALRMIARGLSKDTNRNVLLVGDSGVGKTALIYYLGRLGKSGLSFPGIHHHRVVTLSTEGLTPENFDWSMQEAAGAGNVIIVIENVHSYESIYERLMPYLQMPHLGVVATTDFINYDRVLKNHPEFLSRFEKVDIMPTNKEETLAVLENHASLTGTPIKEDALSEIVRLADRFIGNQLEPSKSLAILEELRALRKTITIDDVRQIVSDKTNMPIGAIGQDERKVLVELESTMRKKIVGQDEAVEEVSEAMKRLRTGISDPTRPAGSFLFLGPTGVGKTYTAKILAESYFGRKNAMLRFDMTEFSLSDSIPLFVERLASAIEEAPLSLVFLDELEKSNRLIHNLFLQILDEGRLTRETGREASFKDAIIIATSNAGSQDIVENPGIDKKTLIDNLIRSGTFAPEFLNRFSGIILFRPLDKTQVRRISALLLNEFAERLFADKGLKLLITEELVDKVAGAGFDPQFGARPINRAIEEIVENKVAEFIMKGEEKGGVIKIM